MAEQYIQDAAFWARALSVAASSIEETVLEDEDEDILTFRIRFATGRSVMALSSRPSNLRSKQGRLTIDEAGFVEDLRKLMKAAVAFTIWNKRNQINVISTHDGIDNPFNEYVQEIEAGNFPASLHVTDFKTAITQGLYRRICLVNGEGWTADGEIDWEQGIREFYGVDAEEELDCIASSSGGKVFHRDWFRTVSALEVPQLAVKCRFWDFAATEKKVKGDDPDYSVGVLMGFAPSNRGWYVLDVERFRLNPGGTDDRVKACAIADGRNVVVRWEQEGGSSGVRDTHNLTKMLAGWDAGGIRPQGDKLTRAKALASQAKALNVYLMKGAWVEPYRSELAGFPDRQHDDQVDASSGAFNYLTLPSPQRSTATGTFASWS